MIMAGLEFMKDIPFRDVYIHGTVRDIEGKKMSKSLGNIIDPLDIINEFGSDALRFSIISITAQGQDIFLSRERFEQGRNFANKIWNASRFILMNLEPTYIKVDLCEFFKKEDLPRPFSSAEDVSDKKGRGLDIFNRWILSRFYSALKGVTKKLDSYKFNEAANILYAFFWHEFCDWYLEIIKPNINPVRNNLASQTNISNGAKNRQNQVVMYKVLEGFLRALHPFMPFVTEEIWQRLPHDGASIMIQPWPHIQEQMIDKKLEKETESIFGVIKEIRNLRSSIELKPDQKVVVSVYPHTKFKHKLIENNTALITNLAKLETLKILDSSTRPASTISAVIEDIDIYLHFSGLLDISKEKQKIKEKINELGKIKNLKEQRIKNPEFLKKAPKEIVEKEKESIGELKSSLKRLERMHNELL